MSFNEVLKENNELRHYIMLIEAELSRQHTNERNLAKLRRNVRNTTPAYNPKPKASIGKIILNEIRNNPYDT